jgi:osmotically-inducible protein OsmY
VREIIAGLKAELPYAADDIKAVVRDGHVTLKGEVEWDYQRRRAADHTEGFTFAVALIQPAPPV